MKNDLERDLGLWEDGLMERDELRRAHPDDAIEGLLSTHEQLKLLAAAEVADPEATWARIAERIEPRTTVFDKVRAWLRRPAIVGFASAVVATSGAYAAGVEPVRDAVDSVRQAVAGLFGESADGGSKEKTDARLESARPGVKRKGTQPTDRGQGLQERRHDDKKDEKGGPADRSSDDPKRDSDHVAEASEEEEDRREEAREVEEERRDDAADQREDEADEAEDAADDAEDDAEDAAEDAADDAEDAADDAEDAAEDAADDDRSGSDSGNSEDDD